MTGFINRYIATIVLFLSVLLSSVEITIVGKPISNYVNIQLILIYVFKISYPGLNFGKGIFLFLISIINDVLNGLWFGTSGILYFIVFGVAAFQASIKLRSLFISEWISFGFSLIFAYAIFFGLEILYNQINQYKYYKENTERPIRFFIFNNNFFIKFSICFIERFCK